MNAELAERAMLVFEDVFLLEGEERRHAVLRACNGDEPLRRQVESLLENISGIEIEEREIPADDSDTVFTQRSAERYELREEIGRGGMGVVYRACDTQLNRDVAIKVMRGTSPDARRRFSAEAGIAAGLQHPGIPPIHDVGLLPDGRPYLAMKLVEGRTLTSLLAERTDRKDDQTRFLAAFESLGHVIAYAHSHDIIHRDLKPDNVMVGKFGEVQVMDWGLAKSVGEGDKPLLPEEKPPATGCSSPASPTSYETRVGSVMGTPAYMPPEQLAGKRDKRTDVFSLGAILCEILTGSPPYTADTPGEILNKSAKADLDEANRRLDQCCGDAELVQLARQCLLADRDLRPADGAEVAGRVSAYMRTVQSRLREAEIEKARSDAKAKEERKRHKLTALLMATLLLLLATVFGGWVWAARRETKIRSAAIQRLDQARTEAIRLHQSAIDAPIDDLPAWEAARVAIEQARSMMTTDVPRELTDEVNELAKQIVASRSNRLLLGRIEQAREQSLVEISTQDTTQPSERERLGEKLQTVFETTPLNPTRADTKAAQQFIHSMELPIKEAIIGAIDEWIVVCNEKVPRLWLARMISAVDDNTWRKRWRSALLEGNASKLLDILDDDEALAQSPRSVLNLCRSARGLTPDEKTEEILRQMGELHLGDFWLNVAIGDNALKRGELRHAVQHYHLALGKRPLGSLHRKLGFTKLRYPEYPQALEHAQRAIEMNDRSATSWEILALASYRLQRMDDARLAYERRLSLSDAPPHDVIAYVRFLEESGRGSEGIEYIRRLRDSEAWTASLQFFLISLLMRENRFLESIEECERMSVWPGEGPEMAPMLRLRAAVGAVRAYDGLGPDRLPNDRRDALFRKAHWWLTQVWVSWETRVTWQRHPVLDVIIESRDSGRLDSVYREDALQRLPNDLRLAWSDFWSDIQQAEIRMKTLKSMVPENGSWFVLEPVSVTSE